ncbi:NAD(P)H-dependent oxidoreductase [Pseudonocardia sp. KRD-184]|uniref:NAD(P)H-dependent oxidoreductase n=2 Tax=Pseudonocardia TaxID=1847 RepID=A0A6M6JR53_9PSEU|nr:MULTISPECIES: NADPH-dependent FMN reductase [Pseudonocardia]MBW0089169.1 NAD(P)H-dependent oxidoreductase [Pseudonocardia oceani]MBW0096114.1 NAD(P)H-dependent oxidoreductase [Pseudonocardia oceani]MBW0111263.1 NAD(P)H-dependent oxidoreductase [Pseudonocardia oceani]MBW0120958.1 NAD(P)H-dependent oxidoreductase [Pseudonocardia oceani]MBW0130865.1 NAD(P)H-dependent oxidoreductase [Pseudonocardia oceani]
MNRPLHVVGIGGTVRTGSSSEQALRIALARAEAAGATTRLFAGAELARLPMYAPEAGDGGPVAADLVEHLRRADGVIVASPGYHGSISGLVKNALDYTEDMRGDGLPYLADRSVGLIVTAYGWQAAVTTLTALRAIVHALRGWVTPYGAAVNSLQTRFVDGACAEQQVLDQLHTVADEVVRFADLVTERRRGVLSGAQPGEGS